MGIYSYPAYGYYGYRGIYSNPYWRGNFGRGFGGGYHGFGGSGHHGGRH